MALHETLSALGEMTLAISRATTAEAIHREALAAIRKLTRAERAAVLLFDAQGVMRFQASLGLSEAYLAAVEGHTPWTPGQRDARSVLVEDVEAEPSLGHLLPAIRAEGIGALAFVPLVTGGGTIGKFMVYHSRAHHFDQDELHLVEVVASHTAFALDRHRAVEALRASEARHRAVVEHLGEVVYLQDPAGHWTYLNPAWETVSGHPAAACLGRKALDYFHPEDRAELAAARARVLAGGAGDERHRVRCLTRSGAVRWVDARCSLVRGPDGEARGTSGTLTDVTEQRALAEALEETEQRLWETQRQESLVAMAGGIAHDFNNLLMGVLGNASAALSCLATDSGARAPLEDVVLAAQRAAGLTTQLLAYTGKGTYAVQALDLSELVRESTQLLATALDHKATLTLDCPPGLPPVEGDPTQLKQVAMNLLSNAADALGEGTGAITLRTERVQASAALLARAVPGHRLAPGPCVALSVIDSGAGMDDATRRRIFDPFFTTKFPGRGLGLAAVLGIVRAHRGAIVVESAPGRGSTLQVLLPEGRRPAAADVAAPASASTPASRAHTVLVVDDEPLVRSACGRILGQAGYQVLYAENGLRALELLEQRQGSVDAVLLDLTMPELSGEETLARVHARWPGLKVVLSSGYHPDGVQTRSWGASEFVQKPFTAGALREAIGRVMPS